VKEGKNLENLDKVGSQPSDPYAYLEFPGNHAQRTKTINDNLNPEWQETFEFVVKDPKSALRISLYDEDVIWADDMGSASMSFAAIKKISATTPFWRHWMKLENCCRRRTDYGKILLEYSIVPVS